VPPISELFSLQGRTAIITGGSRGLGEEIAEGLAEAGAKLMLCARRDEWLAPAVKEFRARGFTVESALCDVSKPSDVQAVVGKTLDTFGQVDILVNNAGISWGDEPETMPLDKWQKVIDVNLTGAFLFSQAAGREMLKRQYGRIINIASIAGLHASVNGPHYVGYAASKAGLMGLTREMAGTWGRQGINVNAIAPGYMETDNTSALRADPVRFRAITERIPAGKWGTPQDLAGAAIFLASRAADYVHGHVLVVDGGWLSR
jgi:gluconate 5-dehydrogenase